MPDHSSCQNCSLCSQLKDREYASQKHGWEQNDTSLPEVASQLVTVRDLSTGSARQSLLLRCPECGTYYLYQTDYEYLAGGSEDDQTLTRLTTAEADRYLQVDP